MKGSKKLDIVMVKPEIRVHKIDYLEDEFIILASDGIFDNWKN